LGRNLEAPVGAAVRAVAARTLARVVGERIPAEDALVDANIAVRDQPLLAALVYGGLRWYHRLGWQCSQLLNKPLKHEQLELDALLRIGLLQLQHFRIPAHAAVSATVDAAAELGLRNAAGLVNAVLRRYQRERSDLERRMQGNDEARFSHPRWLIDALAADWPERWPDILEANNRPAPMWLRVNLDRTPRDAYVERLIAAGIAARGAEEVPSAVELAEPVAVEALPGFAAGEASVQDVAAQRAVAWLAPRRGERVLDACAAPGGKTGHILEACGGEADVLALDRDRRRLPLVRANLERLRYRAEVVAGDALHPHEWWDGRPFDRILIDAPCSAIGVVRRHPDIKVLRRPADVESAATLQAAMLRALWPLLRPGGRLVYATCTVLRRENDAQIEAFTGAINDAVAAHDGGATRLQLLPGERDGDGFYYACLAKSDVVP
jgi:16S rRNA (cytosine967-C5)-methyltransferase